MRPILVNIPSKVLFVAALVLAAATFARDLWRGRTASKLELSSTPLYALVGAGILYWLKSESWAPVPIYAYGVMLGTSLIVGWFIAMRLAREDGIPEQIAGTIYMWAAVWSIIGARLLWFITDPPPEGLLALFQIWQGGLVAYGGMILGFLYCVYACRKHGIELLRWADVSAPSVVLGTGITRVGCLLFGCDYGKRTDLPWGIRFPGPNPDAVKQLFPAGGMHGSPAWQHQVDKILPSTNIPIGSFHESFPVHPTQVYESLVGVFLFLVLMFIRRHRKFSGEVFLGWVLGYGIMRPLIEIVRDDDDRGIYTVPLTHLQLSTSQIIGIVSVVLGLGLLVALVRKYRRDPAASRLWEIPLPVLASASGAPASVAGGASMKANGAKRRKRR
jgi:phosphatidylglycerol:prolipoprotein diacylglycerol transferase